MRSSSFQLPNKAKGKNDQPLAHQDCFVVGLQMSVAQAAPVGECKENMRRRRELKVLDKEIRNDPSAFSDPVKKKRDAEMREFADKDIAAASGFGFVNNDFLFPYGFGGTPSTDALMSSLLHVLASDQVSFLPSCLAIVMDNATTNKSIFTIRAFALLLELIPPLREVHLYFPSVGHTHNSLDAHFGALARRLATEEVGTPNGVFITLPFNINIFIYSELAACFEKVENTRAHADFNLYAFSKAADLRTNLKDGQDGCGYEFENLSRQHYFMVYRDNKGGSFIIFSFSCSLFTFQLLDSTTKASCGSPSHSLLVYFMCCLRLGI